MKIRNEAAQAQNSEHGFRRAGSTRKRSEAYLEVRERRLRVEAAAGTQRSVDKKTPFGRTAFDINGAPGGNPGRAARALASRAYALERIPKNRPLGGFLNGIPRSIEIPIAKCRT